jgi:Z1 domain
MRFLIVYPAWSPLIGSRKSCELLEKASDNVLTAAARNLIDATLAVLANDGEHPKMARVSQVMLLFRDALGATAYDCEQAEKFLHANLVLKMDKAIIVAPKFESWLRHRKADINKYYWNRYRQYLLHQRWGLAVLRTIDDTVDDLLDYAGDPHSEGTWARRGLVVGNVQSGKTATYTALCNKAADAGYKIIILLAGTLNSLRYQTQQRLDEGFIGFDSAELGTGRATGVSAAVGVGLFNNSRAPHAFTTKRGDFDASTLRIRTRLDGLSAPVLMVIKKNKNILKNLHDWLETQNPSADGKIEAPLLLIDDEADAASVNTGSEADPRAINAGIRKLLSLFARSSYVGVTATPFANVFISPESRTEMLDDDLFPRHYIYSLEAPSNYFGPVKIFLDEPKAFLREVDDAEIVFPPRHKKDLLVESLPVSMVTALYNFLVVNAIRDLRNQNTSHRSMLVNVSWANGVQKQVALLLQEELDAIIRDVQAVAAYSEERALSSRVRMVRLKEIFDAEYAACGFSWAEVQSVLFDAIKTIDVRAVNMSSRSRLDYDANSVRGLRVIAVGGNALSRGITLEGLTTSYIFRNSQAYDTLLQMGRWFGYRPDYEDLCRIWLSKAAESWYSYITEATEELRGELQRMHDLKMTPRQFGLKVRAHPDSLIVTARAKMKTAVPVLEGHISLSMQNPEGVRLSAFTDVSDANIAAAAKLIADIGQSDAVLQSAHQNRGPSALWNNVPKRIVAEFLAAFQLHPTQLNFQPNEIARFLARTDLPVMDQWDIVIPSGERVRAFAIADRVVFPVRREIRLTDGALAIAKLGFGDDESLGLDDEQIAAAKLAIAANRAAGKPALASREYRTRRTRPLLMLYFIEPVYVDGPIDGKNRAVDLLSIKLSVPRFDDEREDSLVLYQANKVWQETKLELLAETDEDDLVESPANVLG